MQYLSNILRSISFVLPDYTLSNRSVMDRILVTQVYANLLSLEKKLTEVKQLLEQRKNKAHLYQPLIPQFQEAMSKMRKTANLLQLSLAKKDWTNVVRNTEVFYGLSYLVRGELLSTYGKLLRNENEKTSVRINISSKVTRYH